MKNLVELFKALGDPIRLQMIRMIAAQGEVACTEFESTFSISKPTISYHVKALRNAELIRIRKEGKYYFYRLSDGLPPAVLQLVELVHTGERAEPAVF